MYKRQALTAYNDFLQTEYARINHNIYKEALLEKADLLVKMGNKEEAYGQYGKVFSSVSYTHLASAGRRWQRARQASNV